jgi:acetylornithine deacetylase/succinyl-diaminopimelate desuccinylase-like protein
MSDVISFLQDLIRIPSLTGSDAERRCGERVRAEMQDVGFDEAWVDPAGNAIGVYRGREPGPAMLLLTHLDVVDAGDPELWAHPPFDAVREGSVVHGRGAVDIKGPLAAHVYSIQAMQATGARPRQDVVVLAAAGEETVGEGTRHFTQHLPLSTPSGRTLAIGECVVSEPSNNRVMLGHRGVMRTFVRFHGRAHHASLALNADNPHFALATFFGRLEHLRLREHPVLGRTTVAPTMILSDTRSQNLTPNTIELLLDVRYSTETVEDFQRALAGLTDGLNATVEVLPPDANGPVSTRHFGPDGMNSTGFVIERSHALVARVQSALELVRGGPGLAPEPGVWQFATDGRHTHAAGIPTVGFGPGDPMLAHTTHERIDAAEIREAIAVFETALA